MLDTADRNRSGASSPGARGLGVALFAVGLMVGVGGALEFRYFGPATQQFWAGVVTVPAGLFTMLAAVQLWRRGAAARAAVRGAAVALLAATVIAGPVLRVMGPPAILLGALGSGAALWWVWRQRPAAA